MDAVNFSLVNVFGSEAFLNPQMNYLYFLQNLRLSAPQALSDFFMEITFMGESLFTVTFMALMYWCINKKCGEFVMFSCTFGYFIGQVLKLILCIYRPWIIDSRILPYDKAIPGAYGYSFPSGHTTRVTLNFGGAALFFKSKIFKIFCMLMIILVAFSRNFLGVHSLQDVIVGFLLSVMVLIAVKYFFEKVDLKNNKVVDVIFTLFIIILGLVSLYYIKVKSYPMDYVSGELLVNPLKMQTGVFKAAGLLIGVAFGSFCERHYINFQISPNIYKRVFDGAIGFAAIYVLIKIVSKYFISAFGMNIGFLIAYIIIGLFVTAIYPFFIKKTNIFVFND